MARTSTSKDHIRTCLRYAIYYGKDRDLSKCVELVSRWPHPVFELVISFIEYRFVPFYSTDRIVFI
jgi:hypothetical protein